MGRRCAPPTPAGCLCRSRSEAIVLARTWPAWTWSACSPTTCNCWAPVQRTGRHGRSGEHDGGVTTAAPTGTAHRACRTRAEGLPFAAALTALLRLSISGPVIRRGSDRRAAGVIPRSLPAGRDDGGTDHDAVSDPSVVGGR